jgi:integrase
LKSVREKIITDGKKSPRKRRQDTAGQGKPEWKPLNRKYVNDHIGIIRRMFRWAASEELVPYDVYRALTTLENIHKGRDSRVTESRKIRPVPEQHVLAVKEVVLPQVRAMIDLQMLTGMRPDEVTIIRPCDIDRSGEIWVYVPQGHKMEWKDIDKIIPLGPRAQEILRPWLEREPTKYCFSPKEAFEASLERRRCRSTNRRRTKRRTKTPSRPPRDRYEDDTYCRAVKRACNSLGIPVWTPNRLRHNAGTVIRRKHGIEAARVILGHTSIATTEIYAEKDWDEAIRIMKDIG